MLTSSVFKNILLPALSGVVAALIFTASSASSEKSAAPQHADSSNASFTATKTVYIERFRPAEIRTDSWELEKDDEEKDDEEKDDEEPMLEPSSDEMEVVLTAAADELEARFSADFADSPWADEASDTLYENLATRQQEESFVLHEASCKSQLCRAVVQWDNYELAMDSAATLASQSVDGLNCESHLFTPTPHDPSSAYAATLFLDCTSANM